MRTTIVIGALLGLFTGSCRADDPPQIPVGPFTIEIGSRRISAGGFPNTSGNPFKRRTVSDYRVLYRGRPVAVGEADTRTDRFWYARPLTGGARPAVLVATTGAWLISEVDGAADVATLVAPSSDVLRWQWLDAADGQPGPEQSVTIRDASTDSETTTDGRLLLIGRQVVLDLESLRSTRLPVTDFETIQGLDDFHAGNGKVRLLSPGRTQVVFVGDRYVDDFYEYALVVFELATGRAYAVPFDSNALHFESIWDATPEWLGQYFEWTQDPKSGERIELREPVRALPWQGRLSYDHGDVEYKLHPVGPGLTEPLRQLIETELSGRRVAPTYGDPDDPNSTSYDVAGKRFRLWYDPDRRTLSLFAARIDGFTTEGTPALIEEIGTRFNAILATGAHQQDFSRYLTHR